MNKLCYLTIGKQLRIESEKKTEKTSFFLLCLSGFVCLHSSAADESCKVRVRLTTLGAWYLW